MDQINWGIIGCGKVTEMKSGPAFNKIEGSKLVAVMRRNGEHAKDYAQRHAVPKWYDDAGKLINDPDVNAVYIATPPGSHAGYAIRVAEAGKPVYVEKPMARNCAECERMIEACEKAGVPLFVAYYRRCLPKFLKVKELIAAGAMGEIRFISIELLLPPRKEDLDSENLPWHVRPEIAGGGYFVDLASHQFDFLDFVFGEITSVQGITRNQAKLYPAEDIVCANFVFESGVLGNGIWCFTATEESRKDQIKIVGSKGEMTFSTFEHDVPIRLKSQTQKEEFSVPVPQHIQEPLIQTIVDELRGREKSPSTGVSAARTNWVMDQILKDWRAPHLNPKP